MNQNLQKVALHSVQQNKFLSASTDGKNVNFSATSIGPKEIFYVFYEDQKIILQNCETKKYITILKNGNLECNAYKIGEFEKLTILQAKNEVTGPNQFNLKSHHGKFLTAEENGNAIANKDKAKSCEVFNFYSPPAKVYEQQGFGDFKAAGSEEDPSTWTALW